MRIIFLNTWDGRVGEELQKYILTESKKTDIFCLQEVKEKLCENLKVKLPGFKSSRVYRDQNINDWSFDQVIFCKNNIDLEISDQDFMTIGTGQSSILKMGDKQLLLCNFQGVSEPGRKLDTEERLEQSKQIIDFAGKYPGPKIIGGDFNLMPNTKSIEMIENLGYINLIKKFNITETRNHFAWEYYKDTPDFEVQHFADYVFVTSDIKVKSFEVPNVEVSDHLPQVLEFEL